jgi:hypothetical protein
LVPDRFVAVVVDQVGALGKMRGDLKTVGPVHLLGEVDNAVLGEIALEAVDTVEGFQRWVEEDSIALALELAVEVRTAAVHVDLFRFTMC